MLHEDIDPIYVFVEKKYFFSMDDNISGYKKVNLFSISSYKGEAISFQGLLCDGSMFSYIPIHLISHKKDIDMKLELSDLIYFNCPEESFILNSYDYLKYKKVSCFFKNKNLWLDGEYLFTIEWVESNYNSHFIKLDNGQFCLLPSHKINFNGKRKLKNYHKIREEWKI